ncbi:RuvA C-terminal domain-containing protein [Streptomyces roseolus]|uniref:RuvA C-terminal domain-containing protein n=1 Tax=Streptomyces roseolus TaxID=67358 RepID=UPI00365C70F6
MSAREDAVQAFVNGGWSEQVAREIVASVRAEVYADQAPQLAALRARVTELQQRQIQHPSRFSATPAEIDQYLRRILAEDTLLNYQRAIGNKAVEEAAVDIRMEIATLRVNGVLKPGKDWAASAAADHIDPAKGGGHYPARLLCSQHNGFGRCPGAPWCTPSELHDSPSVPQQQGEAR